MKKLFLMLMVLACCQVAMAQRFTDQLDRGLLVVPTGAVGNSTSNLVSWRRLAEEYYDVKYNLYRGNTKIATNLDLTTYSDDKAGSTSAEYRVAAVVNGVEQAKSAAVRPWAGNAYKPDNSHRFAYGYLDIALAPVYDRKGADVTTNYSPNDAEMADLDGDGQLEIIIKRLNTLDASTGIDGRLYSPNSTQFVVLDAYDVNWQTGAATLMWRIDLGPNMVSLNSTEIDVIAYDWDEDGKAEVVLRGADNMIVYGTDGKTQLYTIGDMSVNTRSTFNTTSSQYAWTHTGAEYLLYLNGETGALYQQTDFPLKRLENGESSLKSAWGDDYGHRSSKYFFGAPFLDGRKASLFLGRGIYTRHKMIAMDLNRTSHTWSTRWTWANNSKNSAWYGNGYHNYVIADVDEDGRDEIVYGSMVIDDNGKGLSTTGLGHGDAQHVSDFDPYRKGLEFFGCQEDHPGMNYRNATTSQLYYRHTAGEDDGRALMANFSNNYPGAQGRSVSSGMVASLRSNTLIDALGGDGFIEWGKLNFRIYWDGDLCSEILDSPGTAKEAAIYKPGDARQLTSSGCNMNNDSKNNACFQGDILGDWREEIVVRCGTNIRVYTTGLGTAYSLPSLWFDHQYRQAMVWQMMAYNQPPHLSYFLGEMEGLTVAPPPLTTRGRTEIASGGTIGTAQNGKHVLLCDAQTVGIAEAGVSPKVITVNVNSVVAGNNDNNSISTTYNATQLGDGTGKGDITGAARLVKQGDGKLKLTARSFSYTGATDVWGGTLFFRGQLPNSDVWMNRHTTLFTAATYGKSVTLEYGARLCPSYGKSELTDVDLATTTISTLNLHEGSRMVIQLDPKNNQYDQVNIGTLNLRTRTGEVWEQYGPQYLKPVIEIQAVSALRNGASYKLGTIGTFNGSIDDFILEGAGQGSELAIENGELILKGKEFVTPPTISGEGKVKTIVPGESSLDNAVSVYYTTSADADPIVSGTRLEKNFVKMPNETTYYFYTVSSSGTVSEAVEVHFDGVLTETYDFEAIAIESGTMNASFIGKDITQETSNQLVKLVHYGDYTLGNRFASSFSRKSGGVPTGQDWWIRSGNGWNCLLTYTGNQNTYYLSVLNLKDGDKITFTLSNGELTVLSSNLSEVSPNETLTSNTEYTVSTTSTTTHLDLSGKGQSTRIKKVVIKSIAEDETVSAPVISTLSANGNDRIVGITPGVGSQGTQATETFYTTDGSDPADEQNASRVLYTEPFAIGQTSTVKAVSYIVDDASEVASQDVEAGTTITLPAPVFTATQGQGGTYSVTIGIDRSQLTLAPQTVGFFYSIDEGETLHCDETHVISLYGGQTLTAYASTEGYNDSEEASHTFDAIPLLNDVCDWMIDFTQISSTSYWEDDETRAQTENLLGTYHKLVDDATGLVLNDNFGVTGKNSSNRFYIHNGGLYSYYSGGRNIAVNVTEGQYVRIRTSIAPNSSAGGLQLQSDLSQGNAYMYRATQTTIATINIPRYTVIYSIEVFSQLAPVSKTITAAGWATYCSPYALDFSQPIDNLTQAYYVTGIKENGTTLTLLPITSQVPAGTGILLEGEGECLLPVLSGSAASTEGNLLVGVLEPTVMEPSSIYVLMREDDKTGFFRNNKEFTVGAQTAYLPAEAINLLQAVPTEARAYKFFDDDEQSTGITTATLPILREHDAVYNLQGQRVTTPRKGLYIIGGKKIFIK